AMLRHRADLLRFLPDQDYRGMTGKELLDKKPAVAEAISKQVQKEIDKLPSVDEKWGMIAVFGLDTWVEALDERFRSPFLPYGLSGIMVAAAAVFFAYIGFDAISTHSEEARRPQRDVPIGILSSLMLCTLLYFGVSAVITGMEPYPVIDPDAAVAEAFRRLSVEQES